MPTFILERVVPAGFDPADRDQAELHSRWAADAYVEAGIAWLGGVATDRNMYSLVVADNEEDVDRYCRSLGVSRSDYTLRRVVGLLGPFMAMAKADPRYRSQAVKAKTH